MKTETHYTLTNDELDDIRIERVKYERWQTGRECRDRRKLGGLSLDQLSALSGFSRDVLSRFEQGKWVSTYDAVKRAYERELIPYINEMKRFEMNMEKLKLQMEREKEVAAA